MTSLTLPSTYKRSYALIELSYGSPELFARYTNLSSNIVLLGKRWTSVPSFELNLPEEHIQLTEEVLTLEIPVDAFLAPICNGQIAPKLKCSIKEVFEFERGEEGSELMRNGSFADNDDFWVVQASNPNSSIIFDSVDATIESTDGTLVQLSQIGQLELGRTYTLSYDVQASPAPTGTLVLINGPDTIVLSLATGVQTKLFVAKSDDVVLRNSGVVEVALDDVSCKQKFDSEPEVHHIFSGDITRVLRNPQGRVDRVRLTGESLKSRLDVSLGVILTNQCDHTFGDEHCTVVLDPLRETATIATIAGRTITLSGLTTTTDEFWHRGYIERDGIRITVKKYTNGTTLELLSEPPAAWIGLSVSVTPGCDGSVARCRFWDNEEQFFGIGYAIPDYDPRTHNG